MDRCTFVSMAPRGLKGYAAKSPSIPKTAYWQFGLLPRDAKEDRGRLTTFA